MPQDAVDDTGIGNKGDDAHAAAARAKEGVGLKYFTDQPGPRAAGFAGSIPIVVLGKLRCRQRGGFACGSRHGNPPAVGIGPVKPLAMPSGIGDVRRDAVDALQGIERDGGRAGPGIGRRFQNQAGAVQFTQRIHGQHGPGDVSGLGLQGGALGGIDGRARINGESGMDPGQEVVHERLRQALGLVQAQEQKAAEQLHDRRSVQ